MLQNSKNLLSILEGSANSDSGSLLHLKIGCVALSFVPVAVTVLCFHSGNPPVHPFFARPPLITTASSNLRWGSAAQGRSDRKSCQTWEVDGIGTSRCTRNTRTDRLPISWGGASGGPSRPYMAVPDRSCLGYLFQESFWHCSSLWTHQPSGMSHIFFVPRTPVHSLFSTAQVGFHPPVWSYDIYSAALSIFGMSLDGDFSSVKGLDGF